MKIRLLLVLGAFAPLVGCINLPGTSSSILVTPVGIVGVHSFAPTRPPDDIEPKTSVASLTGVSH